MRFRSVKSSIRFSSLSLVIGLIPVARAADIVAGNVTTAIGPNFIFDTASTGGGDNNTTDFQRDIAGYWTAGATVTLRGLGWASSASGTTATTATATFTDPGPDGVFGTADDAVVGSVTDSLVFSGVGEYAWAFDDELVFTASGSNLRIRVASDANIRRKTTSQGATGQEAVKLSLAGTVEGGEPAPATLTAAGSGFWDVIQWNTGTGNSSGGVGDADTALLGRNRTVTYRGVPADETAARILLGEPSPNQGQARLVVQSGKLNVSGNLVAGRAATSSDAFVEVRGGALRVLGDADFGRTTEGADGSLIVSGGAVEVSGALRLGAFERSGSMLRFHNPGGSPAVKAGTLVLGRAALDLTFDASYNHSPGQIITLVEYATRDGQFGNYRNGEEFNCGRNRFRIDYDVPSDGGLAIALTALENWNTAAPPPNVVLIFTDDQGYADLQLNGHATWAPKYPMPRLQQIADSGVRFTDAYVTGGVCHPSRCGLLTGRYQQRYGTDNNLSDPSYNGMAVSQRTVPNRLQGLGYKTYGIGKWHLGSTVEYHPNVRGFDHWYGMWGGSRGYYNVTDELRVFQNQMTPVPGHENTGYLTDRIGDKAVEFIDRHLADHPDDPFYMFVSFTAVHGPNDLQFLDSRFARLQSQYGLTQADYTDTPAVYGGDKAKTELERYRLAGMTLALDDNIGKILDKVSAEGLTDNTIFVYLNDNGGPGWAQGSGGNWSYNFPLRGHKGGGMTDGSIRVPCAMNWPGAIPAGQVVSTPVISLDFMATFVNAGGAPAPARNGLDGLDLLPLVRDGVPLPEDRALTWRAGGVTGGGSAIRMGDWKMLLNDANQTASLYNIAANPAENNNLAASRPEILAELRRRFAAWETGTIAPFYGTSSTALDSGLERHGISGGYRLKRYADSLAWLSAPFRTPYPTSKDFHFRYLARSTEANVSASAQLAYGLGDSANRSSFIRAIIDYGKGELRLVDGKSGASATAALPPPPADFLEAAIDFKAASKELTFSYGGASVSLALTGSYASLTHFAVGAAAMEGEITTLVPTGGGSMGGEAQSRGEAGPGAFHIHLGFPGMPPFDPVILRSTDLLGFAPDPSVLVENLGGGLYRSSIPTIPGTRAEFFRFHIGAPPTSPHPFE